MIATVTAALVAGIEFLKALPRPVVYAMVLCLAYGAGCVHGCNHGRHTAAAIQPANSEVRQ